MAFEERRLNVPRKPLMGLKAPPSAIHAGAHSKLPRRVATPPADTPLRLAKDSASVADRVASVEQSNVTLSTARVDKAATPSAISKNHTPNPKDKPLPGEKPLPSRPILRLSNSLSPSKDSRTLLDASEEPLRLTSSTGRTCDWPALTPQTIKNLHDIEATTPCPAERNPPIRKSGSARVTSASMVAAAATLTKVITGRTSPDHPEHRIASPSPPSSYASAREVSPMALQDSAAPVADSTSPQNEDSNESEEASSPVDVHSPKVNTFPERQASLRNRFSDGDFKPLPASQIDKAMNATDFAAISRASPSISDSRPHSPSPASFSRPRPGSIAGHASRSGSMKTASRIPIPDSKKATVIEVKKNRLSSSALPKPIPSFGSRRLASPDALKILENGKMRRQLRRIPTDGSLPRSRTERAWEVESNGTNSTFDTPSLSYSIDSFPDDTTTPSSPESHPVDNESWTRQKDAKPADVQTTSDGDDSSKEDATTAQSIPDVAPTTESHSYAEAFAQSPPPTSQFTPPLQTIESDIELPADTSFEQDEAYAQLTQALSHLEGKGSPPKTDVDHQTLLHMFGHLKRGLPREPKESNTLAENAAMAEQYLAQNQNSPPDSAAGKDAASALDQHHVKAEHRKTTPQSVRMSSNNTVLVSKWSDSTPSENTRSPPGEELSPIHTLPSITSVRSVNSMGLSSNGVLSIGYPSRVSPPPETTAAPTDAEPARGPIVHRRQSSPTLGKTGKKDTKPGSVSAARAGIQPITSSFARATASSGSKRTTRIPTPNNKNANSSECSTRGRLPSVNKASTNQSNGDSNKTPRSRSRSRYVLDKINGLFSGRRDWKDHDVPPVPRLDDAKFKHSLLRSPQIGTKAPTSTPVRVVAGSPELHSLPGSSPFSLATADSPIPSHPSSDNGLGKFTEMQAIESLSSHILGKAKQENSPQRKARLLNFAKVLNDSLISAREAQISAETAQYAARNAQLSYEMTQKSLAMLQKLAVSMVRPSPRGPPR